jgi:SnoaL-like domain
MSDDIRKLVTAYHQLNPNEVESLLTPDFVGQGPRGFSWTRSDHINFTSGFKGHDVVQEVLIADNNVAVRFLRTGTFGEYTAKDHAYMHFMRIENGKIAEIQELWDEYPKPPA